MVSQWTHLYLNAHHGVEKLIKKVGRYCQPWVCQMSFVFRFEI